MPPNKRPFRKFRKSSVSRDEYYGRQHRFEHWYVDNQVYFITSRCRDKFPAFETEEARAVFWDRFGYYTKHYRFVPWVTTLMNNHYHTLGYLRFGADLGPMMQRLHGSVAKLVNDLLPERLAPFWWDTGRQGYFDGCIRDVLQARRAYRYTLLQAVRAKLVRDWRDYPHTRVNVELDRAIPRAVELGAYMEEISYARYERRQAEGRAR